ncbi:MAG: ATP-binding protein [Lachnospiraceae bacterium]|nr:ATP-binding protein [Lachnospiraceae bacterium]
MDAQEWREQYFPGLTEEPFGSAEDEWLQWSRFLDMLCSFPSAEELPDRRSVRALFDVLLKKGQRSEEMGQRLPLRHFLNPERMTPVEMTAFLAAACLERDRKYESLFASLQREGEARPTVGLVHELCGFFLGEENDPEILLREDSFFSRYVARSAGARRGASRLSQPIVLCKEALLALLEAPIPAGDAEPFLEVVDTGKPLPQFLCHEAEFQALTDIFVGLSMPGEQGVIELVGIRGTGRRFLARRLGSLGNLDVVCLRMREILQLPVKEATKILDRAARKHIYEGALVYLEDADLPEGQEIAFQRLLSFLQTRVKILLTGTEAPWPDDLRIRGAHSVLPVSHPSYREQRQFWQEFADQRELSFGKDVDLDELVSKYDMSPGRISTVVTGSALRAGAGEGGSIVSRALLEEQIRISCAASFGELATRLESPFTWEDLQLSDESRRLLQEACDRIRYRSRVYVDFGFGRKLPYGSGTSIVLYGPPGTGKTMAAQVMAKELGLDIYRIDLSQVGSKYIGETEKNLGAIFAAARFSNSILFFDEADALFTKRTDVTNSNDRFANSQTAYLLQKIEEYSGMSILATNVMQNFDAAFKRRMTYMIPIEKPDEASRLSLWEKSFPKETPLESDVDFRVYAKVADLTGSSIKSAALSAAFRAAAEQRRVTNDDLIKAVEMEYRRTGRTGIGNELYGALYARSAGEQLRRGASEQPGGGI